jgi:dihydroflavonol-4-reductase
LRSLDRAEEVRAVLGRHHPKGAAIDLVEANLEADAGWAEAVAGCNYVQHVASPIPAVMPRDEQELIRPARDGALRVLKAARAARCRRLVMTSAMR